MSSEEPLGMGRNGYRRRGHRGGGGRQYVAVVGS